MGLTRPHHPETEPATVELLNRAAGPSAGTRGRSGPATILGVSVTVIALLLFGLVMTPIRLPPELGRQHDVGVHFGDPFAVDWLALSPDGQSSEAASATRPLPMASLEPACVGFGRLDWPEDRRQPTVAHCAEAEDVARLGEGDVALLRQILVGEETWYLLRFGGQVSEVLVDVDEPSAVDPPTYRVGPYAAILLPTRVPGFRVVWELRGGVRYHCDVRSPPSC